MADHRVGQEKVVVGRQATGADLKDRVGQFKAIVGRKATGADLAHRVGQIKIIVGVPFSFYPHPVTQLDKKFSEEETDMGLPRNYRFTVKNGTGQTIAANAVKVFARRHKFTSSGALSYEGSEATLMDNGSTIGNGSYASSSGVDNSSDKYTGGAFIFNVTAPASSNVNVDLYLDLSTDGGSAWDDNGLGAFIGSLNFTTSGTKTMSFRL